MKGLKASRLHAVFQEQPIVCKLGILLKQGPLFTQTCMVTGNTHMRLITRSSTAFMTPEILMYEELLEFAGIDEMKKDRYLGFIDTLFLVINRDQKHPFE